MERAFGLRQRYSLDALENFLDGKQVFQNSTAPFIHLLSNRASFDMRSEPFVLEPGSVQLQGIIGMAVSRHCFCPEGAESFYRYLLSEKVQRDVGTVKEVLPFRRSAWEYTAAAEFGWTQARARDFLPTRCCPPPDSPVCRWFEFATFHIREEIYEFMTGQISRDTVIDKILTKWNQGGLR
jgi:ABC-type glycerol-3-phosphate transport system substrate-binding protein